MYDVCCIVICIVIVVVLVLALLPKEQKVKVVQIPPPQVQKVYVKTCPECGAENESGSTFCDSCGAKF